MPRQKTEKTLRMEDAIKAKTVDPYIDKDTGGTTPHGTFARIAEEFKVSRARIQAVAVGLNIRRN